MPKKGRSTNSKKIKKVILEPEPEPQKDLGELMGLAPSHSSATPEVLIPEMPDVPKKIRAKNAKRGIRARARTRKKKNKKV